MLKREDILIEALPYIREFHDTIMLIKMGGHDITEKMERMGKKPEFVAGLRVTDNETLEIARMVLVGNVNSKIVSLISKHGGKGVGLSGSDGRIIVGRKMAPQRVTVKGVEREVDLGWVGGTRII